MQFDQGHKGFSFSKEGPLDMRMNPESQLTAEEIVNQWSEKELGEVFREYGEEPRWRQAAKAIAIARKKHPIKTTKELAEIIVSACRTRIKKRLHPATLIFQALRICVNKELDVLAETLSKVIHILAPEGKIGVISFHSLEDRIVKNIFRDAATPKREGREKLIPMLKLLTKKPIVPSFREIRANPRATSAKMRFAQKT